MMSARWLGLFALMPMLMLLPSVAPAKDKRIRVEFRSKQVVVVDQARDKKRKFILLKPGEKIKVHVQGPLLLNVKIHDVIDPGKRAGSLFTLTSIRDGGTHRAAVQMLLPAANVMAFKGSKLVPSRMKRRQLMVPEGDHVYEFTVSPDAKNGVALRFYRGKKARPREVVTEEAVAAAVAPAPPPAPPPPPPKTEPEPGPAEDESWVVVDGSAYTPPPTGPTTGGAGAETAAPAELETEEAPALPKRPRSGVAGQFGVGARIDFVVPVSEASLNYGVLLDLRYHLPAFKGALSLGLVGGYSPFKAEVRHSGDASRGINSYKVKLEGHTVPVLAGLFYDLPFGIPVEIGIEAGYYLAYVTLQAETTNLEGTFDLSGTAHGYFVGGGVEYPLGPGRLGLAARWIGAPSATGDIGGLDIGGVHIHAGYRLMF